MSVAIKGVVQEEKFDVIDMLALLNDQPPEMGKGRGGRPKYTKADVLESMVGLPDHIVRYAYLLAGNLHIERVQEIIYPVADDEFEDDAGREAPKRKRKEREKPVVLNTRVLIKDADFYRVRNVVRVFINEVLKTDKKRPKVGELDMMAKGLAQCALKMRLYRNHYTLENEIVMAGFSMAKNNYAKTWQVYRVLATSELMLWEDQIRLKLKQLFDCSTA